MRSVVFFALASGLVTSAALAAPKPAKPSTPASTKILVKGLEAMNVPIAPAAAANGSSKSQGANHASDNAKSHVCTHNNPSAQRSAICRNTVSPD